MDASPATYPILADLPRCSGHHKDWARLGQCTWYKSYCRPAWYRSSCTRASPPVETSLLKSGPILVLSCFMGTLSSRDVSLLAFSCVCLDMTMSLGGVFSLSCLQLKMHFPTMILFRDNKQVERYYLHSNELSPAVIKDRLWMSQHDFLFPTIIFVRSTPLQFILIHSMLTKSLLQKRALTEVQWFHPRSQT